MSQTRVKTKYEVEGAYGSTELKDLYCVHTHGCDVVDFYDETGSHLFSVDDRKFNIVAAINHLMFPHRDGELDEGIEYMTVEDCKQCRE